MNRFYEPWVKAGSHWHMSKTVQDMHDQILHKYPHAIIGTIGDHAHLIADPPEDHTPYSQTGWPNPAPTGSVDAIDIQNIPNLDAFAMRLVNESRAGHISFIHYLNWNGHQWHATDGFQFIHPSSDSPTHIHVSVRTDHLSGLPSGWSLFPVVSSHYTVEAGDTLNGIAEETKHTEAALYAANKAVIEAAIREHGGHVTGTIADANNIYPGTVLTLP